MTLEQAIDIIEEIGAPRLQKSLQRWREEVNLSQQELASLAGVAQQTVSRLEKGGLEKGGRNLTPQIFARLMTVIDKAFDKKEAEAAKLDKAGLSLSSIFSPENFGRKVSLASLNSPNLSAEMFRPSPSQERIHQLEKIIEAKDRMIEGYRRLHALDQQIIALLSESGPGSVAVQATQVLEEVERLRAENKDLREWLNAEEVAAVAHEKAAELRERVNAVTGAQKAKSEVEE